LRCNELYAMVKEDRKTNRSFTTNWLVRKTNWMRFKHESENVHNSKHELKYWIVRMTTAGTKVPVLT
jgi:hypothetical protein